jgi:hypothetical protein
MYLRALNISNLSLATVLTLFGAGCNRQPVSEALTPEKSFEEVVGLLRQGLELPGQKSGFVKSSSGASSRFQVKNTITSKLIPPANADEPYRGVITVSRQSVYALRTSVEKKDDEDADDQNKRGGSSLLDESEESGPGFSSFDESLVTESPDATKPGDVEIDSVQRRDDHVDREYELVHKNNRWELSKLDPDTEASIKNAFDRALWLQP